MQQGVKAAGAEREQGFQAVPRDWEKGAASAVTLTVDFEDFQFPKIQTAIHQRQREYSDR